MQNTESLNRHSSVLQCNLACKGKRLTYRSIQQCALKNITKVYCKVHNFKFFMTWTPYHHGSGCMAVLSQEPCHNKTLIVCEMRVTSLPVTQMVVLYGSVETFDLYSTVENHRPGVEFLAVVHHDRVGLLDDGKHHDGTQRPPCRQRHVGKCLGRTTSSVWGL